MQLIVNAAGYVECPLCSMVLVKMEHKHEIAQTVIHGNGSCEWSGNKFRVHPKTGYAEKIKEPAA